MSAHEQAGTQSQVGGKQILIILENFIFFFMMQKGGKRLVSSRTPCLSIFYPSLANIPHNVPTLLNSCMCSVALYFFFRMSSTWTNPPTRAILPISTSPTPRPRVSPLTGFTDPTRPPRPFTMTTVLPWLR